MSLRIGSGHYLSTILENINFVSKIAILKDKNDVGHCFKMVFINKDDGLMNIYSNVIVLSHVRIHKKWLQCKNFINELLHGGCPETWQISYEFPRFYNQRLTTLISIIKSSKRFAWRRFIPSVQDIFCYRTDRWWQ